MRKNLRDFGYSIGDLPAGQKNCITDVQGVMVGHYTIKQKLSNMEAITTGVTAILPHEGNLFHERVPASSFVLNGFGKTIGLVQVEELGVIESPIMLTNTFSIPAVTEGTLRYMLKENQEIGNEAGTINIVVGECNDSYLNDIRGLHIRPENAIQAIENASNEMAEEGAVGAGTGMTCFGYKGGIGTSSRIIRSNSACYTIGALVLSNFGRPEELTILGKYIGKEINKQNIAKPDDGSIMIVIATDAPLCSRQLQRLAKRASLGLARTGSVAHHGSGDIIIAFTNSIKVPFNPSSHLLEFAYISEDGPLMSQLFQGVVESVEEAIINSLFMAETTYGRKNRVREGLPVESVLKIINS